MNLTPLDVRRKEFDKAFRGYDPTEVDLFLKQVADRLEDVQEEARRAEERARDTEAKLVHYEKVELALQEALESARETAKRSEASAEEKARLMIQDAEMRAEQILRDAERERHGLRQDLVRLSSRQAEVAARLRGFLLSELEVLAQFQGDDPVGFIKLQSAGGQGALPPSQARLEAPMERDEPEPDAREEDRPSEPVASTEPAEAPPALPPQPPAAPSPSEPAVPEPASAEPTATEPATFEPPASEPETAEALAPEEPVFPPSQDASLPEEPFESFFSGTDDDDETGSFEAPAEPEPPAADPTPLNAPLASDEPEAPFFEEETHEPDPGDARPEASDEDAEEAPRPAVTGGWDLRSLVTGEERSVAASDEERERIRRILDDLD